MSIRTKPLKNQTKLSIQYRKQFQREGREDSKWWQRWTLREGTNRKRRTNLSHGDSNEPSEEGNDNPSPNKCCRACILQARAIQRSDSSEEGHRREGYSQSLEHSLHSPNIYIYIYERTKLRVVHFRESHGFRDWKMRRRWRFS